MDGGEQKLFGRRERLRLRQPQGVHDFVNGPAVIRQRLSRLIDETGLAHHHVALPPLRRRVELFQPAPVNRIPPPWQYKDTLPGRFEFQNSTIDTVPADDSKNGHSDVAGRGGFVPLYVLGIAVHHHDLLCQFDPRCQ